MTKDGFDTLPEWALRFNFSAHSPSGTGRPDDLEFFEKVVARPQKIFNPWPCTPHAGICVHDYVTDVVAKDMLPGEAFRNALAKFDSHKTPEHLPKDSDKSNIIRDGQYKIPQTETEGTVFELTCGNMLEGVREATRGANKVTEGRWVSVELEGCELPTIGQLDLETGDVIEMKSKWPHVAPTTKRGWKINSVPSKPDLNHVGQVALYWKWLREQREDVAVKIVYANCKNYRVFSSEDCPELSEASLGSALERMRLIALKREKFMEVSESRDDLFKLVAPDFTHFMWKDVSPEFRQIANQVWGL